MTSKITILKFLIDVFENNIPFISIADDKLYVSKLKKDNHVVIDFGIVKNQDSMNPFITSNPMVVISKKDSEYHIIFQMFREFTSQSFSLNISKDEIINFDIDVFVLKNSRKVLDDNILPTFDGILTSHLIDKIKELYP